jgi:hypothetical protein
VPHNAAPTIDSHDAFEINMLAEWEAARSARNFHASRQSKGSIEAMVAGLKMDWLKEILLIYQNRIT